MKEVSGLLSLPYMIPKANRKTENFKDTLTVNIYSQFLSTVIPRTNPLWALRVLIHFLVARFHTFTYEIKEKRKRKKTEE